MLPFLAAPQLHPAAHSPDLPTPAAAQARAGIRKHPSSAVRTGSRASRCTKQSAARSCCASASTMRVRASSSLDFCRTTTTTCSGGAHREHYDRGAFVAIVRRKGPSNTHRADAMRSLRPNDPCELAELPAELRRANPERDAAGASRNRERARCACRRGGHPLLPAGSLASSFASACSRPCSIRRAPQPVAEPQTDTNRSGSITRSPEKRYAARRPSIATDASTQACRPDNAPSGQCIQ